MLLGDEWGGSLYITCWNGAALRIRDGTRDSKARFREQLGD